MSLSHSLSLSLSFFGAATPNSFVLAPVRDRAFEILPLAGVRCDSCRIGHGMHVRLAASVGWLRYLPARDRRHPPGGTGGTQGAVVNLRRNVMPHVCCWCLSVVVVHARRASKISTRRELSRSSSFVPAMILCLLSSRRGPTLKLARRRRDGCCWHRVARALLVCGGPAWYSDVLVH